jgi:hypothetical protein
VVNVLEVVAEQELYVSLVLIVIDGKRKRNNMKVYIVIGRKNNTKVYIVIGYVDFENTDILKVFKRKQEAEKYKDCYITNNSYYDTIEIEEWEVE